MRRRIRWLAAILLLGACDNAGTDADPPGAPDPDASDPGATAVATPPTEEGADTRAPGGETDPSPPHTDETGTDTDPQTPELPARGPEPLEFRKTTKAMMIYPRPAPGSDFRGKLPHSEAFAVYEKVDAPGCRGHWGRVAVAGYVCLDATEPTEDAPTTLPRLPGSRLVPFFYAKNRDPEHPAPVWRSRRAMRDGADPVDTLQSDHVYAFRWRRRLRGGGYLSDNRRRTVAGKDVKHLEPSEFTGRKLDDKPVPTGQVLAWTVRWPHTPVYESAHPEAKTLDKLGYHVEILVRDEPVRRRGETFYPLADRPGYVSAKESRRWLAVPKPPADVSSEQTWLDVELNQQTLTVMRGGDPVYVTLISSGTWKDQTPTGLYRIEGKMAVSDMRSRTGDDEAYHVESVPWVMYFRGRYALHGVYWHNRFGRRTSHGCINLSALDARMVYELTAPHAPPGWVMVFEHEEDPGTVLRVRNKDHEPQDKRKPFKASARL